MQNVQPRMFTAVSNVTYSCGNYNINSSFAHHVQVYLYGGPTCKDDAFASILYIQRYNIRQIRQFAVLFNYFDPGISKRKPLLRLETTHPRVNSHLILKRDITCVKSPPSHNQTVKIIFCRMSQSNKECLQTL